MKQVVYALERLGNSDCCLLCACFLTGLLFDIEGGEDMFLRNVDRLPANLHDITSQTTDLLKLLNNTKEEEGVEEGEAEEEE
jgi:hypothetical protein